MDFDDLKKVLQNKKFQWGIVLAILIIILFWSSSIRMSNWDLLTDQTTGEKIPLALDPYYFLRIAKTIVANGGTLPEVDSMRYPSQNIPFINEIMPQATVLLYNIGNIFGEYSIQEVNVFSPVLYYFIGLILFFILSYLLTRSKLASIVGSSLLAFVPAYLYRTMAGFSDHESIGMLAFFAALIVFAISMKYLENRKQLMNIVLLGIGTAILTCFTIAAWGGIAVFLFIIIPLSFLIVWLTKTNKDKKEFPKKGLIFYLTWIIGSPLIWVLLGYPFNSYFVRFIIGSQSLIGPFTLVFIVIDFFIMKNMDKFKFIKEKRRAVYSFATSVILGIVALGIMGKSIFSLIGGLWTQVFTPWGTGRVGLTVAENAQPFLLDWINQVSPILFWMFFAGMIIIGIEISKEIKNKGKKWLMVLVWTLMICGTLFSRISPNSLMQGTNFISQLFYVGSIAVTIGFFIWLYLKEEFKISPELAILASWMFLTLIAGRSAQRTFFTITPFVCLAAGYLVFKIYDYFHSKKDDLLRPVIVVLLIVSLLAGGYSIYNFEKAISAQATATGPSASYQWQGAMSWVRENTPEGSIFSHWWDYGYWVEYLGERPSVTDGGHAVGFWDHLIGRYVLTTTNPQTAYSFLKSHDVSYFLIDPTDIGKYPAYSRIGSGEKGEDRYSAIPVMVMDPKQTIEKANETIIVYQGGMFVDEDIEYTSSDGKKVFLPQNKASIGGVIWRLYNVDGGSSAIFEQPIGVFFYNGQRFDIPLKYIYTDDGGLVEMGEGLEAVVRIIPQFDGQGLRPLGSAIYLSPKVAKSFMAQNYILNNAFGGYEGMELAHTEYDIVVQSLKSQGAPIGDFVFYNGLRGPIKIWKINYPEETLEKDEFLRTQGDWAEFDNLNFVEA